MARTITLEWRAMRWVIERAFKVIVLDEATLVAIAETVPRASPTLIGNCFDPSSLPAETPKRDANRTVLFVGWVIAEKGIRELLSAWRTVSSPGWVLKLIGPADPKFLETIEQKNDATGIEFLGERSHQEVMIEMARADVFVLPSYTEGFPNVVLEAMALGRPIIATNVGAIPEMLDGTGIVIESRSVGALSEALKRMIGDDELRGRYGKSARDRAFEKYSLRAVFGKYLAIWNDAALSTN